MSRHLTDLQLERFLADAMGADEKVRVEAVLARSPDDAEALRLLRADTDAFLLTAPPAAFVAKVLPEKKRAFGGWFAALGAFAAAALALFIVWKPQAGDDLGVKGTVAWKVTAGQRTLAPSGAVSGGETLSFVVTAAKPAHAAVISHAPDGWFVYVPATPVALGQTLLPTGAKLDDNLGLETLYLVSGDAPFDALTVKDALAAGKQSPGVTVEVLAFEKRPAADPAR